MLPNFHQNIDKIAEILSTLSLPSPAQCYFERLIIHWAFLAPWRYGKRTVKWFLPSNFSLIPKSLNSFAFQLNQISELILISLTILKPLFNYKLKTGLDAMRSMIIMYISFITVINRQSFAKRSSFFVNYITCNVSKYFKAFSSQYVKHLLSWPFVATIKTYSLQKWSSSFCLFVCLLFHWENKC